MLDQVISQRDAIERLGRMYHAQAIWLFGSAACGEFDPRHSDLDFLVIYEPGHSDTAWDDYWGLKEGLQAMFDRKIDLVDRQAMHNPYVIESVEQTRELIYGPQGQSGLPARHAG